MSSLFKPKMQQTYNPAPPEAPAVDANLTPKPPAPMPDEDSPAMREKRRKEQQAMSIAGRASTILTAPKSKAAPVSISSAYTSNKLGSAA